MVLLATLSCLTMSAVIAAGPEVSSLVRTTVVEEVGMMAV